MNRRNLLRSSCAYCLAAGGIFSSITTPAQTTIPEFEVDLKKRFDRPALDSDEGGLWALMDREETKLRRSALAVRDEELNKFLQNMVCKLSEVHCQDIRVHVMRTPWFNASMAPNGMMQIWTGLLLRVENDAQLAAVLGHELGHYLERHSLQRLRDAKSRSAAAVVLSFLGPIGLVGMIGLAASGMAYSREQELRADRLAMQLLQQAGWSGEEAPKIWGNLLAEAKVLGGENVGSRSPMFATHPAIDDRRQELGKLISGSGRSDGAELSRIISKHRTDWLQDEIRRGQYEESLALFDRLIKSNPSDAQAMYARGEVFRLRNISGDSVRALDDFIKVTSMQSITSKDAAPAWRSMGLVHQHHKHAEHAVFAFEKYLDLNPEASDETLIKHYLKDLKP